MRYLRILNSAVLETGLMHGFCAYNEMLYGVTWDHPAKLAKIDPTDLTCEVTSLESGIGTDIKPAKGYLWAITYWHTGAYLYRIDPTDLSYTLFRWSGIDYPHSIIYDNNNTLYIGGDSGGILKVDISDVNNPVVLRITTGHYMHHVMVWCEQTQKLAFLGINQPYTTWDSIYTSRKYLFIYDPSTGTITTTEVDYSCTDDGAVVDKYAYFAVESIPTKPPWPRTIYKIDTTTGVVTSLELDETILSPFGDGVYYDGEKLLVSYRASGARNGTLVTFNPDFTEVEYFSTEYEGHDLAPDEIVQIGNLYFGTSMHETVKRVFSFLFFDKACSEYKTQSECEAFGCYWWLSDGKCHSVPEMLCEDYLTQAECEAAGCYWYRDSDGVFRCHHDPEKPPCSSYTDSHECYIKGCYWWGGACHEMPLECAALTDRDDCINAGCYWYKDPDGVYRCHEEAPPSCNIFDNQADCEAAGCRWYNNACHEEAPECPDYDNRAECEAAGCYWYQDEDDAYRCHSTVPCSYLMTQAECEAAGCYWWSDGTCHSEPEPLIPTAYIDSIYSNPSYEGDEATFIGHGYDPDGTIIAYEWASDIAGFLSDKSAFAKDNLPVGEHTISFKVQDNDGNWSEPVTEILVIEEVPECSYWTTKEDCEAHGCFWWADACHPAPEPTPPIAVIDSINPNPATEGEAVSSEGHGITEGSILEYEWTSDIVGVLSNYSTFSKDDLPVGTHAISFRVRDNLYGWSEPATDTLIIEEAPECADWMTKADCEAAGCYWYNNSCHAAAPTCKDFNNQAECELAGCYWYQDEDGTFRCHSSPQSVIPIAVIDSINPNPAVIGTPITFDGHGYDPDGGTITGYEWTSDIVGLLSNYRTFTKNDLPIGEHHILFRVKDDEGDWSEPITDILAVTSKQYTFNLKEGWNCISFPVIPEMPKPIDIFEQEIWWLDPEKGWVSILNDAVECGKGYYVWGVEEKTVTISGEDCVVTLNRLIGIYNGLQPGQSIGVGPGKEHISIIGSILAGHVMAYNAETDELYSVSALNPTEGYELHKLDVTHDTSLTIDITDAAGNPITKSEVGQTVFIDGQLKDVVTDEPLQGATITLHRNGIATGMTDETDENGIYSISYTLVEADKPNVRLKTVFEGLEVQ